MDLHILIYYERSAIKREIQITIARFFENNNFSSELVHVFAVT